MSSTYLNFKRRSWWPKMDCFSEATTSKLACGTVGLGEYPALVSVEYINLEDLSVPPHYQEASRGD
jgi:hypothetical protein